MRARERQCLRQKDLLSSDDCNNAAIPALTCIAAREILGRCFRQNVLRGCVGVVLAYGNTV